MELSNHLASGLLKAGTAITFSLRRQWVSCTVTETGPKTTLLLNLVRPDSRLLSRKGRARRANAQTNRIQMDNYKSRVGYVSQIHGVAFSLLAMILGECSTNHSLPTLSSSFFFFFKVDTYSLAHTNSTLNARIRISPQWLSGLRWMCPNVFWQAACELVSG